MKKLTVILLAMLLTLSFAATSFADVEIKGEGIVRGIHTENSADASNDGDDDSQYWDQRFRLVLTGKANDNVSIGTRFTVSQGKFNGAADTNGSAVTDWAFVSIKAFDGTFLIGRQDVSWGNKFMSWSNIADRFKYTRKIDDNLTVGGFIQKDKEVGAATREGDKDSYSIYALTKNGDMSVNVIGVYTMDNADYKTPGQDHSAAKYDDQTGYTVDVAFTVPAGPTKLIGEVLYKGGDLNKTVIDGSEKSSQYGFFVVAPISMDAITLTVGGAYTANGLKADNDFTPTLLFGTTFSNPNAITDFGGAAYKTVMAVKAKAEYKVDDNLSVGGTLARASWDTGADDMSLIEIDLFGNYKLADKADFFMGLAYGMPKDFSADDDPIITLAHKITVTF